AMPYKDQLIDETATVVKKLDEAGAVLLVKLTLGALAMGDIWYGGVTKNPWNLEQGSSGSSAGSASATAAGLVPFAIGTETLGSIVSPSTRCGTTGLRPTFGRVSRHGAMALSWSMDKIGPICRSAQDAAIVFETIRGEDGLDKTVKNAAFNYNAARDVKKLKVGYVKKYFEADYPNKEFDNQTLEVLRKLGVELHEVEMPEELPIRSLLVILYAEAAAAFDELTRSKQDSLLVNQRKNAWPNIFRASRFIPAVEYINANRLRQMLIEKYHEALNDYDVIVTPSYGGSQLQITNLTGHPCVVVPNGFNDKGSPVSISFLGKLFGEAAALELAGAYQQATEFDDLHPEMFLK
ncbi:MAG TPA: amidase, partial [Cyclobacteriaceae bacterium]|nr:amidase [Cyclobacteriaceae bacterium]